MEAKLENFKGNQIKHKKFKSQKKDQITVRVIQTILIYK